LNLKIVLLLRKEKHWRRSGINFCKNPEEKPYETKRTEKLDFTSNSGKIGAAAAAECAEDRS